MTGTGTQADPYIVSTFADFRTAINQVDVYVELGPESSSKVIDANDEGVNPFSNNIQLQCTSIKGNGWRIRNLYFNGNGLPMLNNTKTCTIDNLHFENIVCNNGATPFLSVSKATFTGCSFSGVKYTTSQTEALSAGSSTGYHGIFNNCTFAFKVVGESAGCLFSYCDFKECNFNIISSTNPASGTYCDLFRACTLENSLLRGSIVLKGGGSTYLSYANSTVKNVFAAVELSTPEGGTASFYPGNAAATSCIVSDLIGSGITYYNGTNVQYVSAAQGKNAEYLASIGFPVVGV